MRNSKDCASVNPSVRSEKKLYLNSAVEIILLTFNRGDIDEIHKLADDRSIVDTPQVVPLPLKANVIPLDNPSSPCQITIYPSMETSPDFNNPWCAPILSSVRLQVGAINTERRSMPCLRFGVNQ